MFFPIITRLLTVILAFSILLSACSKTIENGTSVSPQDLEKISKEIGNLSEERNALAQQIANKYVSFSVMGEVLQRGASNIDIFGSAIPSTHDWSHEGALGGDGNIIIENPKKENISAKAYADPEVYYMGRTSSKNRFGATVPVNVYTTDIPSEVIKIRERMEKIASEIDKLKEKYTLIYAQIEAEKFNRVKDNPQELFKYANEYLAKQDKDTAIKAFRRILEIEPNNADAHVMLGHLLGSKEEYKLALSNNPSHIEAQKGLGRILLSEGWTSEDIVKEQAEYLKNIPNSNDPELDEIKNKLKASVDNSLYIWGKEGISLRNAIEKEEMFIEPNEIKMKYAESESSKDSYRNNMRDSQKKLEELKGEFARYSDKIRNLDLDINQIMRNAEDWNHREKVASELRRGIKALEKDLAILQREIDIDRKYLSGRKKGDKYYEQRFLVDKELLDKKQEQLKGIEAELAMR